MGKNQIISCQNMDSKKQIITQSTVKSQQYGNIPYKTMHQYMYQLISKMNKIIATIKLKSIHDKWVPNSYHGFLPKIKIRKVYLVKIQNIKEVGMQVLILWKIKLEEK